MAEQKPLTPWEQKWGSVSGGALAAGGLFLALHSGLALMGLFGHVPVECFSLELWLDFFAGSAVLLAGLAIRTKVRSIGQAHNPNVQQDVAHERDDSEE